MGSELIRRIERLANDRESGASELVAEIVGVLSEALKTRVELRTVARALLEAQPSMAPVWNLVGQALAAADGTPGFDRYAAQVARASQIITRHTAELLRIGLDDGPLRIVTISYSGTVLLAVEAIAGERRVEVACAEGRPALEGRRLAARLAERGVAVTHYSDAALAQALGGAHAVLVGADAVTPDHFLNKSGTLMLAAAATLVGVPVYVCASREKFVSREVAARLRLREESPDEIWATPPFGVTVKNRYFEAIPLDLVTAVISDLGVLGAGVVADACTTSHDQLLLNLVGSPP